MSATASPGPKNADGRQKRQPELPPTPPESSDSESQNSEPTSTTRVESHFPLPPPASIPTSILDADVKTPDSWLPRDPRLIRLTGNHPFNVEPPLSDLYDEGFLTSPELFYVRNHGPVPRIEDSEIPEWEFSVEGLVERPFKIKLNQLIERFEQRTCPVTLVCAGNRRKEQNMVRKSKGFNWGAAGLSTALFTGPTMADILKAARPIRGARYVCMEGADELPNGRYATSVKLNWAMDPNKGFMLAHRMNGEMLRPDHGKPLRVVIPGQIGGRSVKWLKRLILNSEPSDNWYHIYDNRVLPTMISPETAANEPSWWTDERYAIYDLSPNSAIAFPAHDEVLNLDNTQNVYKVCGYAYSGGGKRITRVELSLDQGCTWRFADIDYPEDEYRDASAQRLYDGTMDMSEQEASFCWSFWNVAVDVGELAEARDLVVRAMDEGMCIQPRDLYWNVMGMMNNPWFRVAIHKENGELRFEHPTQPALQAGGWMERVKKAGGDIANGYWGERIGDDSPQIVPENDVAEISMKNPEVSESISAEQLREHEIEDSPWFVVEGEVYDGTSFLKEHPGGAQSIESAAGQDVTEEFLAIHSETARAQMKDFHIGSLHEDGKAALSNSQAEPRESNSGPSDTFLEPRNWKKAVLHSKSNVSWDTRLFTFRLDHEEQQLGLPVGHHVLLKLRDPASRELLMRSYTPISRTTKKGFVDVLVKVYFDTKQRKGGKMSHAMESLPLGHTIEFKGPLGRFEYLGSGKCRFNGERKIGTLIMVCAGTGITPMHQILTKIMGDNDDSTRCIVLNGNRMLEDILCKDELDGFAAANKHKCEMYFSLTKASDGWGGIQGRIDPPLLKKHAGRSLYGASEAMVLICGPEGFERSVRQALMEDGWGEEDIVLF